MLLKEVQLNCSLFRCVKKLIIGDLIMAFYRFGRLSDRECIRVADRLGLGQQFDKYTVFLRLANGGRFGILEKHSLPLKHIDAKIQIDVLYGDTKNYRSNIFFWNSKYGDQIPENAIIIGDTKNAGFLVYIYSGVEKGIYYWDDSYALECSDQNSNAYFIADDIERLLFDANASFKKIFNHKTTRLPDKIIGENNMLYRVPGSKKLQKVNAIACKLNTHRCNNFCIKPEFTREYELECLVRDAIKWVEKETEYVFSDALKEYIFDDSLKSIKSTHFSVLGQVGGVKGLTALRFDDYDFDNDGWRINFAGYDVEHAIEDGDTQRAEALKELHKDYIVFARVSDDCCVFGRTSNDYFAIKKSTDEIFVYNRDDLRMEKVADDFESFIVRFYNEDKWLKHDSDKTKADNKTMKWEEIRPLESEDLIDEYEQLRGYKFPLSFRECVIKNNGGYPEFDGFDTETTEERMLGFFLSFNKNEESSSTVWFSVEAYESNINVAKQLGDLEEATALEEIFNRYVVFADTPFGDDIAFDKTNDSVVYIDHETLEIEHIANSFDEFLDCLYD